MKKLILLAALFMSPTLGFAANFYIDPVNGLDANNGSSAAPWKSLQRLFDKGYIESRTWDHLPYTTTSFLIPKNVGAPVKAGDTIYLRSGSYGELYIAGYYNSSEISIIAEYGHQPIFSNISVRSSRNWRVEGLVINASAFPMEGFKTLLSLESHNWSGPIDKITVRNCNLRSVGSSSDWSKSDWNTKAKNGISVSGENMTVAHNYLLNVDHGITVMASNSMIEHNTIENFSGDGLRGLGDNTTFEYNTVKNCYDVNSNHDDGFQSWSVGSDGKVGSGVVKGIVLRGNTIINYEDPKQPFRGTLQGIGCFDGMFEDWVVERNIVAVDHWHGISLYGARNTIIRDNIVTDPNGKDNIGPPWIMLREHKNGTPSRDSSVSCNVSPKLIISNEPSIINQYNVLSETGGPRHPQCPALSSINMLILPLLLHEEEK